MFVFSGKFNLAHRLRVRKTSPSPLLLEHMEVSAKNLKGILKFPVILCHILWFKFMLWRC